MGELIFKFDGKVFKDHNGELYIWNHCPQCGFHNYLEKSLIIYGSSLKSRSEFYFTNECWLCKTMITISFYGELAIRMELHDDMVDSLSMAYHQLDMLVQEMGKYDHNYCRINEQERGETIFKPLWLEKYTPKIKMEMPSFDIGKMRKNAKDIKKKFGRLF